MGRNNGARGAKGEILVFLDADITVPVDFLEQTFKAIRDRGLDIATCWSRSESPRFTSRFFYAFFNSFIWLGQKLTKRTPGYCIIVSRALNKKLGGFDERVQFEDIDYSWRAAGKSRYGIIPTTITVADRRFVPGNRLKTLYVLLRAEFDRWLHIRKYHWYTYPFGQHPEQQTKPGSSRVSPVCSRRAR